MKSVSQHMSVRANSPMGRLGTRETELLSCEFERADSSVQIKGVINSTRTDYSRNALNLTRAATEIWLSKVCFGTHWWKLPSVVIAEWRKTKNGATIRKMEIDRESGRATVRDQLIGDSNPRRCWEFSPKIRTGASFARKFRFGFRSRRSSNLDQRTWQQNRWMWKEMSDYLDTCILLKLRRNIERCYVNGFDNQRKSRGKLKKLRQFERMPFILALGIPEYILAWRVAAETTNGTAASSQSSVKRCTSRRFVRGVWEKQHWDFKSLETITHQPSVCCLWLQTYLRDVLGQICVYNKKGENRNLYELKPEFASRGASHV